MGRKGGSRWAVSVVVLSIIVSTLCTGASASQAQMGPGDWRYDSLDRLSQAGLLSGHPKGPLSNWTTGLSRFEAAALTLRAVDGVGQACQAQGKTLVQIAEAATTGVVPPPMGEPDAETKAEEEVPPDLTGLTAENLAAVEKLIEEFRTELVEMGARVDYLETAMKDVQTRLKTVESDQRKHKLGGYTQLRYRSDSATDGKKEFMMRRTRVTMSGPVSARTAYKVEFQLDAKDVYTADGKSKTSGSKVQLRTAQVDYQTSAFSRLRVGQAVLPWGYELEESVPNLWTGERAFWMDRLFPEQRDIGVQWMYQRGKKAPKFDIAIVNGTGMNANDNNDEKNLLARVDFPVRYGTVALSGYAGKDGTGASETDQDRYGVSSRLTLPTGTQFLGEFVTGRDKGADVKGWYAQLGHPLTRKRPNLLFAKYDRFDEDTDAPDDLFRRWSLGYWYDLDDATRLTFVYEDRDVGPEFSELSRWDGNAYYLQLQVKY
ncbi:MAG: porin [Armatimonadota bacterium]